MSRTFEFGTYEQVRQSSDPDGETETVHVLVNNSSERAVIRELLEQRYRIATGPQFDDSDLILVDEYTLPEYFEDLSDLAETLYPSFCPVVVVRRPDSPAVLPEPPEPDGPRVVDAVLEAPLTRADTYRRIESLLARRRQTRDLQTTVRDLAEANARLERMAKVLHHDLRNPLQVAQGRLELLKEEHPETDHHVEPIERAFCRIADLIEKLLAIRQVNSQVEREAVNLRDLLQNAWDNVPTRDATLTVTPALDVSVSADREYLLQAFENLINNAVVHGGDTVTVTVGTLEDGFYIEDDGPGVPDTDVNKLLKMGYSTREDNKTSGLGLNIVANTVDAHDWQLTITEGTDGGARFEITDVAMADTETNEQE